MLALVIGIVVLAQAWWLAALALMRTGTRRPDPGERFDAIVVLGCRVRGGVPGPAFARRLEVGCAALRAELAPKLVITGGAVGDSVSEADAGYAYVAQRAIAPLAAIVREDQSRTTRENATCTRALLGDARVLVVTTDWHVSRAERVFARSFTTVKCASAPGKLRGALREIVPWILDRVRGGSPKLNSPG